MKYKTPKNGIRLDSKKSKSSDLKIAGLAFFYGLYS